MPRERQRLRRRWKQTTIDEENESIKLVSAMRRRINSIKIDKIPMNYSVFCHLRVKNARNCFRKNVNDKPYSLMVGRDFLFFSNLGDLGNELELGDLGFRRVNSNWINDGLNVVTKTQLYSAIAQKFEG